jgi:2-keto-3-deoxy-L-rhamnonate aldolase RhmA
MGGRSGLRGAEAYKIVGDAGKALGMGGIYDNEIASRDIKGGVRMVLSGSDHNYIVAGAKARAEILRGAV